MENRFYLDLLFKEPGYRSLGGFCIYLSGQLALVKRKRRKWL